jgi:(p)ppGpp synthase/HD superfamily hydrolase
MIFKLAVIMEKSDVDKVLDTVRDFADQAHGEQMRKYSDDRYIVHPVRVMEVTRMYAPDVTIQAAALLHDVLEDTTVTEPELKAFLESVMERSQAERTFLLVKELTDVFIKNDFPGMGRNLRKQKEADRLAETSADAQTIKYADILDNTDITHHDPDFAKVFLKECKRLLERMKKGNPELRSRVLARVEECMAVLKLSRRIYE